MHWAVFPLIIFALWQQGEASMVTRCPPGWEERSGYYQCYTIPAENLKKTFDEAMEYCRMKSAHLLVIKDDKTLSWVKSKLDNLNFKDVYTNAKYNNGVWTWMSDNSSVNKSVLPLAGSNNGHCSVVTSNGDLKATPCEEEHSFMCQRSIAEKYCPNGWKVNDGRCYLLSNEEKTWTEAQVFCQHHQADLISINTWTELDFVHNNIERDIFIGYTDKDKEGDWVWSDGSAGVTNWVTGRPNKRMDQNCAVLRINEGKYDDIDCDSEHNFVCEMSSSDAISTQQNSKQIKASIGCDSDWFENPQTGECYFIVIMKKAQSDAMTYCKSLGTSEVEANLISLSTAEEHKFVWEYIKNIGYSQQIFTLGMKNEIGMGNYWLDGSPVGFFNWNINEPSGDGTCVEMYASNGFFNDINCIQEQSFICEKKGRNYIPPTPPAPPNPTCDLTYEFYNKHCYYISAMQVSWDLAEPSCRGNLASYLASIENEEENNFIKEKASDETINLWIGLKNDGTGGNWYWVDGTAYNYTNWESGQPHHNENEKCAQFKVEGGLWDEHDCEDQLRFVCKVRVEPCPAGWKYWNGKCYYPSESPLEISAARQKCKELDPNSNLVTIESLRENTFVTDLYENSFYGLWIGYTYDSATQSWNWDDGSSSSYSHWNDGEPNFLETELCTQIIHDIGKDYHGKWNNVHCVDLQQYVCQLIPTHYLGCDDGWELYEGICYRIDIETGNYADSDQHCKDLGAQLATVHTAEENDFIVSLFPSEDLEAWIGVTDIGHKNTFRYSDDTNLDYSNWLQIEGYDTVPEKCAAVMSDGKWEPKDCSSEIQSAVVCSRPPEAKKIDPIVDGCSKSDLNYRGSCYSISESELSWDEAKSACENDYSTLLRIEDEEEGDYFASVFGDYWPFDNIWTDVKAKKYPDESYEFLFGDGTPASYLPWDADEPVLENGDCVKISTEESKSALYGLQDCQKKSPYICEYEKTGYTTLPPGPTPTHGTNCLKDWDHFEGHCYEIYWEDPRKWTEAEQLCQSYGGHLASVNSYAEENFLADALWADYGQKFSQLWVGLELESEADKHWTDGSSIDFIHWDEGQPKMHDHENCASVNFYTVGLSSTVCESMLPFICESNEGFIMTTQMAPTFEPQQKCDDGEGDWYLFNEHCYKFISEYGEDAQSWDKSIVLCRAEGAHLTSIANVDENAFIENMLIGLLDSAIWVGGQSFEDTGFEWVDGTAFDYENWAPGEPNHYMGQEDCIEMSNWGTGQWNDNNCGIKRGRVCKRPYGDTVPPITPTLGPAGNCPEGWMHVVATGRCFRLVTQLMSFVDAHENCMFEYPGALLVSLHSPKEMAYITAMIGKNAESAWIGLKLVDENYVWVDQTSVGYTPWAPGQPDGRYEGSDCVKASYPTGLMDDVTSYIYMSSICAMRQDPSITDPTPYPKCDPPYDGYYRYMDKCYKSVAEAKTWEDAENACAAEGAHLASAFDMHEDAILWILGQDGNILHPWIGLNSLQSLNTWMWSDDWPVVYTNWGEDQPQVNVSDKNCVRVDSENGHWYNEKCEEVRPFLCKHSEDVAPTSGPDVPGHCPDDTWVISPGPYCFLMVTEEKSWNNAHAYCMFLDSDLTSIHSGDDNVLINHILSPYKQNAWTGLIQKKSGLGWSDGTGLDYTNWAAGEPSGEDEECTEIYYTDGTWNDVHCDHARAFLCRAAKIPDTEPTSIPGPVTTGTPGTIPTGTSEPVTTSIPGPVTTGIPGPVTTGIPRPVTTDSPGPISTNSPGPVTTGTPDLGGLSGGAIFGIVVAVLIAFAAVGFVGYSLFKRKNTDGGRLVPSRESGILSLSSLTEEKRTNVPYTSQENSTEA